MCRPPLAAADEEDASDPFVLAYRRGLAVVAGELQKQHCASGTPVSQSGTAAGMVVALPLHFTSFAACSRSPHLAMHLQASCAPACFLLRRRWS